jgi:hypothetical protein
MFQQFGFQQYGFQVGLLLAPTPPTTYHQIIRSIVGGLVGLRYYPNKFPQEKKHPTWPAIRGTIISGDNEIDQCGAGELEEENARAQLDLCADGYDEGEALFRLMCAAMAAADPPWIRQPGRFEGWDYEAKVHRFTCDFVLYQSSPE